MLLDEFVEQKTKELERLEKQEDASVSQKDKEEDDARDIETLIN